MDSTLRNKLKDALKPFGETVKEIQDEKLPTDVVVAISQIMIDVMKLDLTMEQHEE